MKMLNPWTVTCVVMVFALVGPRITWADEREELERALRDVQEQIEELEARDEHVPHELGARAAALTEELQHFERMHEEAAHIEHVLDMLHSIHPRHARNLRELREREPDEFHHELREIVPWLEEMMELREEDRELFDLEVRSHKLTQACEVLADQARDSEGDERKERIEELRDQLRELFRIRLAVRRLEIERLEQELRELRGQVDRMSTRSDQMIDRRLQMMLDDEEDW